MAKRVKIVREDTVSIEYQPGQTVTRAGAAAGGPAAAAGAVAAVAQHLAAAAARRPRPLGRRRTSLAQAR